MPIVQSDEGLNSALSDFSDSYLDSWSAPKYSPFDEALEKYTSSITGKSHLKHAMQHAGLTDSGINQEKELAESEHEFNIKVQE